MSTQENKSNGSLIERRQEVIDRRLGMDRRRGAGIRRSHERKAAEQGEMTDEQFHFLMAIDSYKRQNQKPFPSWTEVIEVIKALGYRKVAEPCSIDQLQNQPEPAAVG